MNFKKLLEYYNKTNGVYSILYTIFTFSDMATIATILDPRFKINIMKKSFKNLT